MNVLILGSGGREHALAWKIAQSEKLSNLYIAPGNAGTAKLGENINIGVNDFDSIKNIILEKNIEMFVVGPEEPLVKGIYDYIKNDKQFNNLKIIGSSKLGAQLEGSKQWAKEFMEKHNIPTAKYKSFNTTQQEAAYNYIDSVKPPYVLKADGLAAGKGVLILNSKEAAKKELKDMFAGKFGEAGKTIVVEEFLDGIELSVFVLTDGENYILLPEAKDYKRIGEGDTGLNTGGMGAISPVPFASPDFMKKIEEQIVIPTIDGLKAGNIDYKGFIFFGLIKVNNNPFVIEYNVRMGDPEAEVVIPRIKSDLLEMFIKLSENKLKECKPDINEKAVATVMMVSGGYPEKYEKGKTITFSMSLEDSVIFHAGTKIDENKNILTNGGRVIALSSYGNTIREALNTSYKNIEKISFDNSYYRKDIGFDLNID